MISARSSCPLAGLKMSLHAAFYEKCGFQKKENEMVSMTELETTPQLS